MKKKTATAKQSPILTFEHAFKVEVFAPVFEPLSSIDSLDVKKLSTGRHRIAIGFLKGGCGKKLVHAIIRKGIVESIEAETCEDSEEAISEEIKALFLHAIKELDSIDYWEPVPVKKFLAMVKNGSYPPRAGTGAGCFYVCYSIYCLFCCKSTATSTIPKCWIERRKPDVVMGV